MFLTHRKKCKHQWVYGALKCPVGMQRKGWRIFANFLNKLTMRSLSINVEIRALPYVKPKISYSTWFLLDALKTSFTKIFKLKMCSWIQTKIFISWWYFWFWIYDDYSGKVSNFISKERACLQLCIDKVHDTINGTKIVLMSASKFSKHVQLSPDIKNLSSTQLTIACNMPITFSSIPAISYKKLCLTILDIS